MIGNSVNHQADGGLRYLEIHYVPDNSWNAQEPKKISIEWEILYGEQSLRDNLSPIWFENNPATGDTFDLVQKGQFADRDDFNDINGVISLNNSTTQQTYRMKLPFPENGYDYKELFGIKLKNPGIGTSIYLNENDVYSGGTKLRTIAADSNSNLQLEAIPKLI